jgi:hypothetical protein
MGVTTKQMMMTVRVGGLLFRFRRLRARRATRGAASLVHLLGPAGAAIVSGAESNGVSGKMLTEAGGLSALARTIAKSAFQAGKIHDPDVVEKTVDELLAYGGGEGTEVSPDDGKSWIPVNGLGSLDSWEAVGHVEVIHLLRVCFEFNYLPSSAGSDTNVATGPAAATTGQASAPDGASSGPQTSGLTGVAAG